MTFTETKLLGSYVITPSPAGDTRGWFMRVYCKEEFEQINHTKEWVQINHSYTLLTGTVRGMHYQVSPYKEIKMVRCIAGAIYDVIIDLRKDSPTFLQWFSIELSALNKTMLYIPEGFAHGFQTLTDNTELIYHHTAPYNADAQGAVRHDDPLVGIRWPLAITELSQRDKEHPLLTTSFQGISHL